jgi:uncharacterized Fe-S center protein
LYLYQRSKSLPDLIKAPLKFSGDWADVEVKGAKSLKKAKVAKDLLDCDAFIDVSIAKDHDGTRFSGCLKNVMGACTDETNRFFHAGSGPGASTATSTSCLMASPTSSWSGGRRSAFWTRPSS